MLNFYSSQYFALLLLFYFFKLVLNDIQFLSDIVLNGPITGLPDDAIASLLNWNQSLTSRILTWSIRYSRSVTVFGPQTTHRSASTYIYAGSLSFSFIVNLIYITRDFTARFYIHTCFSVSLTVKSHEIDLFECICCL